MSELIIQIASDPLIITVLCIVLYDCGYKRIKEKEKKKKDKEKSEEEDISELQALANQFYDLYGRVFTNKLCDPYYSQDIGQCNKFNPRYNKIINNLKLSDYSSLIIELAKYHLSEQILILEDEKLLPQDKMDFLNKNYNSFGSTIENIRKIDDKVKANNAQEEKIYISQRVKKHEEFMKKINQDIEENKAVFIVGEEWFKMR